MNYGQSMTQISSKADWIRICMYTMVIGHHQADVRTPLRNNALNRFSLPVEIITEATACILIRAHLLRWCTNRIIDGWHGLCIHASRVQHHTRNYLIQIHERSILSTVSRLLLNQKMN